MVVQWLKLCFHLQQGEGLIPGLGTKIPHGLKNKQTNKQTKIYIYRERDRSEFELKQRVTSIQNCYVRQFSLSNVSFPVYKMVHDLQGCCKR